MSDRTFNKDEFAELAPWTRILAHCLHWRLNQPHVDDNEQEKLLREIQLLRSGHYGDFSAPLPSSTGHYFISMLEGYILAAENDPYVDYAIDATNDSLVPVRVFKEHLEQKVRLNLEALKRDFEQLFKQATQQGLIMEQKHIAHTLDPEESDDE